MTKKQVIAMSFLVAIPAVLLLAMLVMSGMSHGGNMFKGVMTVIVALTGVLVLGLALSPFAAMAFYPAEGFATFAPPPPAAGKPSATSDDADGESVAVDDDEGFDDGFTEDGDDFGSDDYADDAYAAAGDDSLFEEGYDDEEYDDDSLFEDEEEWT
ncbi:MAG: hypothetical protein KDA89_17965 [Planctomycetaceae bacterium]|nr:hypothetical protein [Planctomycetaceae bacterium]